MAKNMKVSGLIINHKDMEFTTILKIKNKDMRVIGRAVKKKEKEYTTIKLEHIFQASGKMMLEKDKEFRTALKM